MKNTMLTSVLLSVIAVSALPWQAQATAVATHAPFNWSCDRNEPPSVAEIRDHFGIANAGQAYQWRGIAHRYLQRECRRAARMARQPEKARQAEQVVAATGPRAG
jgi:hypothetical protein